MANSSSDTISTRIALEGGDEVRRQLEQLGASGEKALGDISTASGPPSAGLSALSEAVAGLGFGSNAASEAARHLVSIFDEFERGQRGAVFSTIGASIKEMGEGLPGIATAAVAAAGAILLLGRNAAAATLELQNQAAAIGLSVEQFEGLKFAAGAVGVSQEALVSGLTRFTADLGRAAREQEQAQAATEQASVKQAAAQKALNDAVDATALSAQRAETASRAADDAVTNAGLAADAASRNLQRAQQALDDFLSPPKTPEQVRAAQFERLKQNVEDAANQAAKADEQQQLAIQRQQDQEDQAAQDRRKANEAQAKADQANIAAMNGLVAATGQLADAASRATGGNRQLSEALKNVAAAGFAATGGDQIEALKQYADELGKFPSVSARADAARRDLGRGFVQLVPFLALGSQGIQHLMDVAEQFTITATDGELTMARNYTLAATKMETVTEGLKNAVGNILGQLWTPAIDNLATFLADSQQGFRDMAQAVVDVLKPPLEDIGAIFSALEDSVKSLGRAFNDVASNVNDLFGTHLTGANLFVDMIAFRLGFSALSLALTGVRGGLIALAGGLGGVIGFIGTLGAAIGAAVGTIGLLPFAAIIAGLVAIGFVVTTAILNWDRFKQTLLDAKDGLVNLATGGFQYLAGIASQVTAGISDAFRGMLGVIWNVGDWIALKFHDVLGGIEKAWASVADWFNANVIQPVINFFQPLISLFDRLIGQASALGGAASGQGGGDLGGINSGASTDLGGAATPFAGGGRVPGWGRGDIVPAMLTPGEYVMRTDAVRAYGLGLFEALNGLRLKLPGFNLGGLVRDLPSFNFDVPRLAFADGGMVPMPSGSGPATTSGHTLAFHFPGGEEVKFRTDRDVYDAMARLGKKYAMTSAGKKPSSF